MAYRERKSKIHGRYRRKKERKMTRFAIASPTVDECWRISGNVGPKQECLMRENESNDIDSLARSAGWRRELGILEGWKYKTRDGIITDGHDTQQTRNAKQQASGWLTYSEPS